MMVLMAGSVAILMLGGAYYLFSRTEGRSRPGGRGHADGIGSNGELPGNAFSLAAGQDGSRRIARKEPSSMYQGSVCFFDSVEHRDMFEANHHRPVLLDPAQVPVARQFGLRSRNVGINDGRQGETRPSDVSSSDTGA